MFKKVLIANRGEIALRVVRACQEMGVQSVVVHSTRDHDSAAVLAADECVQIDLPGVPLGSFAGSTYDEVSFDPDYASEPMATPGTLTATQQPSRQSSCGCRRQRNFDIKSSVESFARRRCDRPPPCWRRWPAAWICVVLRSRADIARGVF